jgi:hypothetical protein
MNITEISNNTEAIIEALAFNEDIRLLLGQCQRIILTIDVLEIWLTSELLDAMFWGLCPDRLEVKTIRFCHPDGQYWNCMGAVVWRDE